MSDDVTLFCARAVITLLDGNYSEFIRLRNMAIAIYDEEEQKKGLHYKIEEVVPEKIKETIYKRAVS